MLYNQAMKHFKNHRKDKFYQQCAFTFSETGIKSGSMIAEETAEKFILKNIKTGITLSEYFNSEDEAVDFYETLKDNTDVGIYTDKGNGRKCKADKNLKQFMGILCLANSVLLLYDF